MIKLDIINEVVNRTGITKTKAEMAVETVFESMKRALGQGERIELRGFGIFNVRPRKTGIGRNPAETFDVEFRPPMYTGILLTVNKNPGDRNGRNAGGAGKGAEKDGHVVGVSRLLGERLL